MNALIEYFVSRNIFVNLLTAILIGVGTWKAVTMNREAFPNIDFDIVVITTIYPGASPQEVEKLVTKPIEDAIKEVDGMKEFRSSSIDSRSGIVITIDPDVSDPDKVTEDIRSAVDRVDDLPDDAEDPVVLEISTKQSPVIEIGLAAKTGENGQPFLSEKELRDQAEILENILLDIPGVARVARNGWRDTEIHIDVDPGRLKQSYMGIEEIIQAVRNRNINLPGGRIENPEREITLRTTGEFESVKEIPGVPVRSNDIGSIITVGDIASVKEGFADAETYEKVRANPAVTLTVLKRESADIIELVDRIKETVDTFKGKAPAEIEISYVNDISYFIRRRLGVLVSNGVSGLILVVVSLFFFMGWRTSLMVALGIPVSMGVTFMVMDYMGVSLNLISMFGLILVIGILVDDAIIVSENFYRYLEEGYSTYEAGVKGTTEVVAPIMGTVSTTIAAFAPLMFMSGIFGKFIFTIPLVIIIALLASLAESFFILPSHLYDMNKYSKHSHEVKGEDSGWFLYLRRRIYEPSLRWALNRRYLVMILITALFFGAILVQAFFGKFRLFPDAIETFQVKLTAPMGVSKEYTSRFIRVMEYEVMKLQSEELDTFTSRTGIQSQNPNDPFTKRGSNYGQLMVYLTPERDRERNAQEIINQVRDATEWMLRPDVLASKLETQLKDRKSDGEGEDKRDIKEMVKEILATRKYDIPPGYEDLRGKLTNIEFQKLQGGPPVGRPVAIEITGDDFRILKEIAEKYKSLLLTIDGIVDIDHDFEEGKDEVQIKINERLAAQTGVHVTQIALAVNSAFQGAVATTIKRASEEVDVRVRFAEKYRKDPGFLKEISVVNRAGKLIPLGSLITMTRTQGLVSVNHHEGRRLVTVTANLIENKLTPAEAVKVIRKSAGDLPDQYPGYRIKFGGENEDTQESMSSLLGAFLVGFLIIFMILASLFRSLVQPVVVIAAIPFALIGVVIAFVTHGHPFSFMSIMGIIGLSGVVVNDSIVLVDFANNYRQNNPDASPFDSVFYAGSIRLRAVMLTTITTVLGLLPTAYGIGGHDPFLVPMALAFSWGLSFATLLTLIVVPCQYLIVQDFKSFFGRFLKLKEY